MKKKGRVIRAKCICGHKSKEHGHFVDSYGRKMGGSMVCIGHVDHPNCGFGVCHCDNFIPSSKRRGE